MTLPVKCLSKVNDFSFQVFSDGPCGIMFHLKCEEALKKSSQKLLKFVIARTRKECDLGWLVVTFRKITAIHAVLTERLTVKLRVSFSKEIWTSRLFLRL